MSNNPIQVFAQLPAFFAREDAARMAAEFIRSVPLHSDKKAHALARLSWITQVGTEFECMVGYPSDSCISGSSMMFFYWGWIYFIIIVVVKNSYVLYTPQALTDQVASSELMKSPEAAGILLPALLDSILGHFSPEGAVLEEVWGPCSFAVKPAPVINQTVPYILSLLIRFICFYIPFTPHFSYSATDGTRCCRSDWHGLCLLLFSNLVCCQPQSWFWAFFFVSYIFQFYLPHPDVNPHGTEWGALSHWILQDSEALIAIPVVAHLCRLMSPQSRPHGVGGQSWAGMLDLPPGWLRCFGGFNCFWYLGWIFVNAPS